MVKVGDGPGVTLLLPGALGTIRSDMTTLLDGINSKGQLTLVAWDPPGYGASRPPERTWDALLWSMDGKKVFFTMWKLWHTGNGITGRMGRTGQRGPIRPLFHFLCIIYHIHTVQGGPSGRIVGLG